MPDALGPTPDRTLTPWARRASVAGADLAVLVRGETPSATGEDVNGRRAERSSDESYDEGREAELVGELRRLPGSPNQ